MLLPSYQYTNNSELVLGGLLIYDGSRERD